MDKKCKINKINNKYKMIVFISTIIILLILSIFCIIVNAKADDSTLSIKITDKDYNLNLQNAKFTIKKISNGKEEEAKDAEGNLIGNIENIGGTEYRVINSNSKGEVNLNLPSGKYKVTEVQAPEGYELNENNTYEITLTSNGTYNLNYLNKEWDKTYDSGIIEVDIKKTQGEEYLALVVATEDNRIPAEETTFNTDISLAKDNLYIFRYNSNNKISEFIKLNYIDISSILNENTRLTTTITDIPFKIVKETDNYFIIKGVSAYIWFNKTGNFVKDLNLYSNENYISADTNYIETNDGFIAYISTAFEIVLPSSFSSDNTEITLPTNSTTLVNISNDGIITNIKQTENVLDINYIVNNGDNNFTIAGYAMQDYTISAENTTSGNAVNLETDKYYLLQYNSDFKLADYKNIEVIDALGDDASISLITPDNEIILIIKNLNLTSIDAKYTADNKEIKLEEYGYYLAKINENGKIENITKKQSMNFSMIYQVNETYITYAMLDEDIPAEDTLNNRKIEIDPTTIYELTYTEDFKIKRVREMSGGDIISLMTSMKMPIKIITLDNNKMVYLNYQISLGETSPIRPATTLQIEQNFNIITSLEKYQEKDRIAEEIDKQELEISNSLEPSLQIIKQDEETGEKLQGAKFTISKLITNTDGSITEESAIDINGNIVGDREDINGKELNVCTTNSSGIINVKLPEGKYKVTEVQAPEGYILSENNSQEIEITKKGIYTIKSASQIYTKTYMDAEAFSKLDIYDAQKIENGKYAILGALNDSYASYTISANETSNNKEIILDGKHLYLIRFTNENKIENVVELQKNIYAGIVKITDNNAIILVNDTVLLINYDGNTTEILKDIQFEFGTGINGNYGGPTNTGAIIYGSAKKEITISADKTLDNNEIKIKGNVVIILNNEGKIVKAIQIQNEYNEINVKENGEFTLFEYYSQDINNQSLSLITSYNKDGEIIEQKQVNELQQNLEQEYINSYTTKDDAVIYEIQVYSDIDINSEYTVSGEDIKIPSGYNLIKVTKEGKIEWNIPFFSTILGEVNDGYLAYMMINGNISGDYTENGREIQNENPLLLVKLNKQGKIQYVVDSVDSITIENMVMEKVIELDNNQYMFLSMNSMSTAPLSTASNIGYSNVMTMGIYIPRPNTITIYKENTEDITTYNKQILTISNKAEPTEEPDQPIDTTIGTVIVRYLDKETNEELLPTETMRQRIGTRYATNGKEVQYYRLDGTPLNAEGTVNSGVTEVIYYYNKQNFNIQTDKTISELYVNGEEQKLSNTNKNIFQVSIHRKDIPNAELKIKYKIVITNSGEIPGTAGKITDMIPEGLEFYAEDNEDYWYLENGYAVTNVLDGVEIQPGESRELEIVLKCEEVGDNMGLKTNRAVAENTKNGANFAETTTEDNESGCRLIVAESLGLEDYVIEILQRVLAALVVAGTIIITLKIKERRK